VIARCRDLYLTTLNTHKRETSMTPAGFELAIPTSERPDPRHIRCSHWDRLLYGYSHANCDNHEDDDDNNKNSNDDDDDDDKDDDENNNNNNNNNNNTLVEELKLLLESVSAATWVSLRTELVSAPIPKNFAISRTFLTVG
jgi:hypothetical protein